MSRVVIVGMAFPWPGTPGPGTEVWGCNRAFVHQRPLHRLFALDDVDRFPPEFPAQVAALNIPAYLRSPHPQIPKSLPFPLAQVESFFGRSYFTSTIAYMLAYAIYLHPAEIVLHQLLVSPDKQEYADQKPCLDYWIGQAEARGIHVEISAQSELGRPYLWQAPRYGYGPERPLVRKLFQVGFQKIMPGSVIQIGRPECDANQASL